ncbi:MAG: hypothetical protein HWN67_12755 [Candidatus Helarchaeota archaeon]|nr:hypothetical protein [Candidatus Helarchaeota archaeon]
MKEGRLLEQSNVLDLKVNEPFGEKLVKNICCEIIIDFFNEIIAQIYFNSLNPESDESFSHRSSTKLILMGNKLKISIDARDVTALRATVNSYLNWIKIIEGIVEITK